MASVGGPGAFRAPRVLLASLLVLAFALAACAPLRSLLATPTPTPRPRPAQLPRVALEDRLSRIVLQRSDLPPGFLALAEGYLSNQEILDEFLGFPGAQLALLESGRVNGYRSVYEPLEPGTSSLASLLVLVDLYTTSSTASQALSRPPAAGSGEPQARPVELFADQSVAYLLGEDERATLYMVKFRSGSLVATLMAALSGPERSLEEPVALAQRLHQRMAEALRAP